jgi:hypothetical protein
MIEVQNVLVHEDLITETFVCNLNKCKGACCVEGDSGAPLDHAEKAILEDIYPKIKHLLAAKGIEAIEKYGTSVIDSDGDLTTPCVGGNRECAYVTFEGGITKCAIEKAYEQGLVDWQKPISCHLYPIRITQYPEFDVLNYDRWSICSDACSFGKALKVPVYKFLKGPLTRKYGTEWYAELENSVSSDDISLI